MTGNDEKVGRELAATQGEGLAHRVASAKRSPRERAILAAKVSMAMLAAQAAFVGYAYAQTGGGGGEIPPSPSPGGCPPETPNCAPAPPPVPPIDVTPPVVEKTRPPDGKTGVDRDRNILVYLSEDMDRSTINDSTVYIRPTIPAKVTYNARYDKAILNPSVRLAKNTFYTVTVEGAADTDGHAVEDEAGNPMATDYTFDFKTGRG